MQAAFVQRLQKEFDTRRTRNPKYSLRAFSQFLNVDHASLSQILRRQRAVPAGAAEAWGTMLGWAAGEVRAYASTEAWAAQALEIVDDPRHWALVRLARDRDFVGNCTWIADRLGVSVDDANVVITRLLRVGMIRMDGNRPWAETAPETEGEFRNQVIERLQKWQTP